MSLNSGGILLLLSAFCTGIYHDGTSEGITTAAELKSSRPINKTRLPHNLLVHQYILQIQPYVHAPGVTYDPSKDQTFDGFARIDIQMLETATSVSVDVYNMTIYSAQVFLNGNRILLVSASYDYTSNRFIFVPDVPFNKDTNYTLELQYSAKILNYMDGGLFASTYTFLNGSQGTVYATQFEPKGEIQPVGSARAFPSFDDPHFKAVFNLSLIHPSSLVALGNTLEDHVEDLENGWTRTTFELTPKMSSYLLAFAVGDLVSETTTLDDGFMVRVWGWRGTEDFLSVPLNQSVTCVQAMNNYTGIKLPLKKLDLLAVPKFLASGMENWGLIINLHQMLSDPLNGMDTNCHEIAHQWFGDLVTNDWWSDLMLHESFATFFTDYSIKVGWPEQAAYQDSVVVTQTVGDALIRDIQDAVPIISKNGNFGHMVYQKGSSVLRMLQATLSPSVFQEGLQNYLNKYKFSTADHHQLFAAMTETASKYPQIVDWCRRPLNVTRFMEPWVTQSHFPLLSVTFDEKENVYLVTQEPFLATEENKDYSWPVPFHVKHVNDSGEKLYWSAAHQGDQQMNAKSIPPVKIPSISSNGLLINPDSKTYARVHYDDYSFKQILDSIETGVPFTDNSLIRLMHDEIAVQKRIQNLGQKSRLLKFVGAVLTRPTDNFGPVFESAKAVLYTLQKMSFDSFETGLFNEYFINILKPLYEKTMKNQDQNGWNVLSLEENFLPLAVNLGMGTSQDDTALLFEKLVSQCENVTDFYRCNFLTPSIRAAVYCGAAIKGGKQAVEQLYRFWKKTNNSIFPWFADTLTLLSGMACATDPSAVSFFVNKTLAGDIPVVYFLRFLTGNPLISDAIHDFLLKSFDDCKKDVFGRAITAMTANWNTPARILQFQKFGEKMAPKLSQDEIRAFNQTLGSINAHASAFLLSRLDILRYLYDATAPIGNNPWTSRLPEDAVAVEAYELSILPYFPSKNFDYPDERNMTFDANSTVTFRALTELNSITIHSHRHVISSLDVKILKPRAKQVSIKSVTRDYKNAFLIVNLTEPIRAGSTVQMTFNYSGFIFVDPKSSGNMMNSVNFKGGPGTRSLLPCFDEPSLKAKWQVTVTYPGEYTALSNTLEESVANIGNGLMQTKFKQTVPMSSYLLALTLGRYSSLNGVTAVDKKLVRIWTWTGMEQYCQQALKFAIDTIDYMTTTLNVSLPLEKFDIVALPQYTGSGSGAMENFGLVIAGYKEVMFDMDSSDTSSLIRVQEVVSHEIVHHWFGDFVTMDWWNHLFLNEGFATFWTPHILRAKSGQNSIADGTIMEIHRVVDHEGLNSGHPVTPAVQEIGGKYPLLTGVYSKASSIITTLKGVYSSDAVFFEGLSRYLKLHELKNADDLGLWRVMDSVAAVHGTPGWGDGEQTFNATEMMLPYTRQWLSQSPITPVEHLPPSFYNYKWTIPLKILTSEGTRLFWLTERSQDLSVSNEQTLFVVNPGAETHVRIVYDDEAWKAVENVLKQDHTKVDETTRAVFLIDAYNDVRDQKISWERFLDSTVYLENEAGFLPWKSVLEPDGGFVYFLNSKLRFHPVYNNFKRYLEIISDKLPVNDLILSSDWSQNLLNSASLELKCMLGDSKCYALTFEKYTQFISQCAHSVDGTGKCNPAPPDFRPTQFCYGLKQQPETLDTLLNLTNWWLERLEIDSYFTQDLSAIFRGLACVEDIPQVFSLITWVLKSNKTGTFQFFDAIKTRDNGQNLFMYLLGHQERVLNHKWFANYIGAMTVDWASDEQLDNIKNFNWTSSLNVEQQDAVDTAISSIVSRRKWLETNGVVIQNWINNFVRSHDS